MSDLSKGFKKPKTGDLATGPGGWYKQIEATIQQVNDHTHNGTDSVKLGVNSLDIPTATLLAANWATVSAPSSEYRQAVNLPAGYSFDLTNMRFMVNNGDLLGTIIYPSVVKIDSTSFYVYVNDNTVDVKITYG